VQATIGLPKHVRESPFSRLVSARRSKRLFDSRSIDMDTLSYLLWAVQGITGEKNSVKLRSVASAGNRHCLNTYITPNRVEGLRQGLYLYDPEANSLGLVKAGDHTSELLEACLKQKMTAECSVNFIWTAVCPKMTDRYGLRGYRYMFLDAGHVGAHLQLACEDVGLGSCNIAAYMDDLLEDYLGIKTELEIPVYMASVGWPI
jgi:SagB-type dehydrogenase family enzyme